MGARGVHTFATLVGRPPPNLCLCRDGVAYSAPAPDACVEPSSVPYVAGAAAFVLCEVLAVEEVEGHKLCRCRMRGALVHPDYWVENKLFCPRQGVPPYLTFFGSQVWMALAHKGACLLRQAF